jgi:hypothetical protein
MEEGALRKEEGKRSRKGKEKGKIGVGGGKTKEEKE